jgi:branched-chain amino acid transport system permease protein
MLFLQFLINGLQLGANYALAAAGFSLIFGSTRVFHVAHGATFALASYVFYWIYSSSGGNWYIAMLGNACASIAFGLFVERFIYTPIKRHEGSLFTIFVASFGVAIVVENVLGMVFGRTFISITSSLTDTTEIAPGLYVAPVAGVSILMALVCFALLQLLLQRTTIGLSLRALFDNPGLIRAYGISPERSSAIAFAIGSFLAAPAATLSVIASGAHPAVGNHVMLISIAATIIGGIGSIQGAAYAGLMLGIAESLSLWVFEPQWSDAITFAAMFVFILFRPSGFFGRRINL